MCSFSFISFTVSHQTILYWNFNRSRRNGTQTLFRAFYRMESFRSVNISHYLSYNILSWLSFSYGTYHIFIVSESPFGTYTFLDLLLLILLDIADFLNISLKINFIWVFLEDVFIKRWENYFPFAGRPFLYLEDEHIFIIGGR